MRGAREFLKLPSRDFQAVYRSGRKSVGKEFILFYSERKDTFHFAVVASRKTGNAVQRNRIKRLMREAFRACAEQIHRPGAYVLVARARTGNRELSRMTGELREMLTRMDLYQKEAGAA